jgi:hypothetical protein
MTEQIFPTDRGLSPSHPPATGLFQRDALLADILNTMERGEYVAIWGPRFTGRTTLLHQIGGAVGREVDCLPVYTVPADHLDPANRESLFRSLAQHIENAQIRQSGSVATSGLVQKVAWNQPGALREFLSRYLKATDLQRLLVLLDDCDQLLSTSLVELARELRAIYHQRSMAEWKHLRKLSFVVAGAVSFRNLKLLEAVDLSAFDDWSAVTLCDPSQTEVIDYLSIGLAAVDRNIDDEAQTLMIDYCGGDLNRVNHLCAALLQATSSKIIITAGHVEGAARHLIGAHAVDPSSSYMIGVITHDPRCLLVLDRLQKGQSQFEKNQLYRLHDKTFGLSNPELSGGFILERTEAGEPSHWHFRNRFSKEVLASHFTAASMMRAFLDLGRPRDCLRFAGELKTELVSSFREKIYSFDENALREWLETHWEHQRGDRVEIGFGLMASLLETFGADDVVLYEKPPGENRLVPNELLPTPPFSVEAAPIALDDQALSRLREVRVYRSSLYSVEIQAGGHLKIVIPLKDFNGELSGIVSFRGHKFQESWATLFVRIPIMERALNFVWRRLSRVEAEQQALLQRLGDSRLPLPRSNAKKGIPVFVAAKVESPLRRHLERQLKQFPEALSAKFLEFRAGAIYDNLVRAMQDGEPLGIFDISKINSNVFFELGLAIGLNRPGFPVLEEQHKAVPELARGLFAHIYTLRKQLGEAFADKIAGIWLSYKANHASPDFIHMLEWSYAPVSTGSAPYLVVIDHNRFADADRFRRSVHKVAAGLDWSVRYLWDREGQLERHRELRAGTILPTQYALLRNANAVVVRGEKVEDDAEQSSHFIPVGIAKGLEEKLGQPAVIICQRPHTPAGVGTDVPSDLYGLPKVPFDPEKLGSFTKSLAADLQAAAARQGSAPTAASAGSAPVKTTARKSWAKTALGRAARSRKRK